MWLNERMRRWMGQTPRQLRRRGRMSRLQKRLTLEALEDRMLLSGGGVSSTTGLIAAINAANSAGGSTTITLAAGTIFNFTSPDTANGINALPVITGNITITGQGTNPGAGGDILVRTAPPTTPFRLFDVAGGGSLTLQNLVLQGGLAQGTGASADGGAIFSSGKLTLSGVTVKSNKAQGSKGTNGLGPAPSGTGGTGASAFGGGLYVAGGSVSLTNDILSSNEVLGGNGGNSINGYKGGANFAGGSGGNGGNAVGGGLYVAGGSVFASNDTFSGNQVFGGSGGYGGNGFFAGIGGSGGGASGGGLHVSTAGSLTLNNDSFFNNGAYGGNGGSGGNAGAPGGYGGYGGDSGAGAGGGLDVSAGGNVTLSGDTFSANGAFGGLGGYGGHGGGNVNPHSNSGQVGTGGTGGAGGDGSGGGLFLGASRITLVNDTLSGNGAQGGFGGPGGVGGTGGCTSGGTVGYNGAGGGPGGAGGTGAGGGLYAWQGATTLVNDTLNGNTAGGGVGGTGGGGGKGGTGTVANISPGNGGKGGSGGAGGTAEGGGFAVPAFNVAYSLANTIVSGNNLLEGAGGTGGSGGPTPSGGVFGSHPGANGADGSNGDTTGPEVSGTVLSSDHDLIGFTSGSSGFGNPGSGDLLDLDPELGALQNNGGPTQTMAELPYSPAIEAGDPNAIGLPATDQRGASRIVENQFGVVTVDIGAYEYAATPPPSGTPALSISGSGGSSTTPGGPLTYTFTVTNNNSIAQSNVDVADSLPANTTLVSWTAAPGWSSSAPPAGSSSGTVTASIASLSANSSATFTLVVQVAPSTPIHTVINNTASFGPFDETSHSVSNSASINTTVLYAPKLQVVDAGGIYDGNPFPATATAVGTDGITPVAGSFSYTYYAGSTSLGSTAPTNVGTYTAVANFTSSDPDYSDGSAQTTFTIDYGSQLLFNNNKPVHSGAVLPIKLALTDASGTDISSPSIAVTAVGLVDSNGNAVSLNCAGNANPEDLFRYDASLGGYVFNLSTKGLAAGTYKLYYTAGADPTLHSLTFVVD